MYTHADRGRLKGNNVYPAKAPRWALPSRRDGGSLTQQPTLVFNVSLLGLGLAKAANTEYDQLNIEFPCSMHLEATFRMCILSRYSLCLRLLTTRFGPDGIQHPGKATSHWKTQTRRSAQCYATNMVRCISEYANDSQIKPLPRADDTGVSVR